jgi:predicted alpha/beta superfamily hydrolase
MSKGVHMLGIQTLAILFAILAACRCENPASSPNTVAVNDTLQAPANHDTVPIVDSTGVRVPDAQQMDLDSKINGGHYRLLVHLPSGYAADSTRKYPVVYITDGFYDFNLIASIYYDQVYDGTTPEYILVGFSYPGASPDFDRLRTFDYSTAPDPAANGKATGGAADFLQVIEKEFIPYMERHFRVDPDFRVLGGSSLGGQFTLYSLFSRPGLFQAYIAISPATVWGDGYVLKLENAYHQTHSSLPVALYMTGAEKEFPDYPAFLARTRQLDSVLSARGYEDFRYRFRLLDDAYHSSSKPEGFTRGLQFAFAPSVSR